MEKQFLECWKAKKYDVFYAENTSDAKQKIAEILPRGVSVSLGGSMTLQELDVLSFLRNGSFRLLDRHRDMTPEEYERCLKEGLTADWLITSTNAITIDGELINVDGIGNRVAPMIYGTQNVLVICGKNKLVHSIEEGVQRVQKIAPLNAQRLHKTTPCTIDGACHDCRCEQRICNVTTIIHNCYRFPKRIKILYVDEILGY